MLKAVVHILSLYEMAAKYYYVLPNIITTLFTY